MQLDWNNCEGDEWCPLNTVNLAHSHFADMEGVYIIWHSGETPATVRVGQGVIKDRIAAHRNDSEVQAFVNLELYVTWASVSQASLDGIEAYLAERLNPKVGERFPDREHIEVNLPW
jgi:hypothetical protein